jgi:hypothetical protein
MKASLELIIPFFSEFLCVFVSDYLEICKIGEGVTLYVCGYASFSVCKVSNCANCHSIVKDCEVDNSGDTYFASLQVYVYRQILLYSSFFICTPFFNILLVTATYKK